MNNLLLEQLSEGDLKLLEAPSDLAEMLGVRRTSVTVVAHTLQSAGFIKYARGKIQVLNEEGLQEGACECYETVKRQYRQLIGRESNF